MFWFGNATTRLELQLEVAERLDQDLYTKCTDYQSSSNMVFVAVSASAIAAFVYSDNFTTMIMWRLVKLRELARNLKFRKMKRKR
jgi:hypothetical protein